MTSILSIARRAIFAERSLSKWVDFSDDIEKVDTLLHRTVHDAKESILSEVQPIVIVPKQ